MNEGVVDTAGKVGTTFIQSLPAQFLLLAFINTIFILGLLWYLAQLDDNRSKDETGRIAALSPVLTECLRDVRGLRQQLFNGP